MTDFRKQTLYLPDDILREVREEALRLDRSYSWVIQHAWRHGRAAVKRIPSLEEVSG